MFESDSQLTDIRDYAFYNCSVSSITLPNSLQRIAGGAFYSSGLMNIEIPASVESLGYDAFGNCHYLSSVTFESGSQLTEIPAGTFYNCNSLTAIQIPIGVESIGESAFYNCNSLTDVEIPNSVTGIEYGAFYNCSSLTEIVIPASVENIVSFSFAYCSSLTTINVERYENNSAVATSVTKLEKNAFYSCGGLTDIFVPSDGVSAYQDPKSGWASYAPIIQAAPFTETPDLEYDLSDCQTYYLVSKGTADTNGRIYIPAMHNNLPVKAIAANGFKNCYNLTDVVFEGGSQLISVGNYAFRNCKNLIGITLPTSVTGIGKYAFQSCEKLLRIALPESVESIGNYAFKGCGNLSAIYIGRAWTLGSFPPVTELGNKVFSGCGKLETIYVPDADSVEAYKNAENWSFYASKISQHFTPTDGLYYSLSYTYGYTNGSFSYSYYYTVSKGSTSAHNVIYIPATYNGYPVKAIGGNGFSNCTNITEVIFENNSAIETISNYAFSGCSNLSRIRIPESVLNIGNYVFQNCSSLEVVYVEREASPVTTLGANVFLACTNLARIYVPHDSYNAYWDAASWADYKLQMIQSFPITAGLKYTLSQDGIYYSVSKGSAVLNDGLYIPAEYNSLPVKAIADYGFADCYSLQYVEFEYVANIGYALTTVGEYAFSGCGALSSAYLPYDTVTEIGEGAFYDCYSLSYFSMPSNVTVIEDWTFYRTSLYDTWIPYGVTHIGNYAFADCPNLKAIWLPESLTEIGSSAFYHCTALTGVTLSPNTTQIGYSAFEGCTGLTSITVPASVKTIRDGAFYGCANLRTVYAERWLASDPKPITELEWGSDVFDNCHASLVIYVPNAAAVAAYKAASCWSGYASRIYDPNPPNPNQVVLNIASNTRYTEEVATLAAGNYREYRITFALGGTKIAQTFGPRDAYLYLYDAGGTLLSANADGGYSLNALIRYNFSANTAYIIRVKFYSASVSGEVKLGLSPSSGLTQTGLSAINQFEDIYSASGTGVSHSVPLSLNETRLFVWSPSVGRSYTVTTVSSPNLDTYLYLIDPAATALCLYNDDGGGNLQARITSNMTAGKQYLIVISAYNITTTAGNTTLQVY